MAQILSSDEARWAVVCARDAAAGGSFVYAVKSTGVYCRPGCPSRRPRRDGVRFFDSAGEAEAAGFRACLRCRPTQAASGPDLVVEACRLLEQADAPLPLSVLAARLGLSPSHLHRLFKVRIGLTPRAFAAGLRAQRLRDALGCARSVSEAAFDAGYSTGSRFYADAGRVLGMLPARFKAGGAQECIRFGLGQCSLGAILVAASESGLCAVLLGDAPEPLLRELERLFPAAGLVGGDAEFETWMARVIGFVESPRTGLDLPLDLRGSSFRIRVWQALQAIPPGTRLSYAELACRLGMPRAVRAVASACAANRLAVVIPCHRVVRNDGGLAGYRWGIARKAALLAREDAPEDQA